MTARERRRLQRHGESADVELTRIVVLMNPGKAGEGDNPFVDLLVDAVQTSDPRIRVVGFTWRRAFAGRYNVLHVHWPELMTRHPSLQLAMLKCGLLMLLVALNSVRRIPHVRTVHNTQPHERSGVVERVALGIWNWSCANLVYMVDTPDAPDATVIPHGDYARFVEQNSAFASVPTLGRIVLFGHLRPYKDIERLIDVVQDAPALWNLTLEVAGNPLSERYAAELLARVRPGSAVSLRLHRLADPQLVATITAGEAAVLPYKKIYNSGAAILALSLGRPVIATASASMRALQREVGPEWLQCLPEEWNHDDLYQALLALRRALPSMGPELGNRRWAAIGQEYGRLYRAAVTKRASAR